MFSDQWIYDVDVLYLENGNVHRLLLKNKTTTMFFLKKLFSSSVTKIIGMD